MIIIWRDTNLKQHKIDLKDAVDVKIDGIAINLNEGKGLRIQGDNQLSINPIASNCVVIKEIN